MKLIYVLLAITGLTINVTYAQDDTLFDQGFGSGFTENPNKVALDGLASIFIAGLDAKRETCEPNAIYFGNEAFVIRRNQCLDSFKTEVVRLKKECTNNKENDAICKALHANYDDAGERIIHIEPAIETEKHLNFLVNHFNYQMARAKSNGNLGERMAHRALVDLINTLNSATQNLSEYSDEFESKQTVQ